MIQKKSNLGSLKSESKNAAAGIIRAIGSKLAKDTLIAAEKVTALERQKNGKFLLLISDVDKTTASPE